MKKYLIFLIVFLILFVVRQFYTLSDYYICKKGWLHGEGNIRTDFFAFEKDDYIKDDTIYINNKAEFTIINRGYRPIIPNYIVVKSISTEDVATFHEK